MATLLHDHFLNLSPLLFPVLRGNTELSVMQYLYREPWYRTHLLVSSSFSLF